MAGKRPAVCRSGVPALCSPTSCGPRPWRISRNLAPSQAQSRSLSWFRGAPPPPGAGKARVLQGLAGCTGLHGCFYDLLGSGLYGLTKLLFYWEMTQGAGAPNSESRMGDGWVVELDVTQDCEGKLTGDCAEVAHPSLPKRSQNPEPSAPSSAPITVLEASRLPCAFLPLHPDRGCEARP